MSKHTFEEIDAARKLLGLRDRATLQEIKRTYRKLSQQYHPDRSGPEEKSHSEEMMKRLNHAYRVIMDYVKDYAYSFRKEDVQRNDPEWTMKRFYDDWMWGSGE